jgi:hypothetical protein
VVTFRQNPAAHQTEIGDVFLIFPAVDGLVLFPRDGFQRNLGNAAFFVGALTKPVEASAEDSAKDASARGRRPLAYFPESEAIAKHAGLLGKGECFRAGPLHNVVVFYPFS